MDEALTQKNDIEHSQELKEELGLFLSLPRAFICLGFSVRCLVWDEVEKGPWRVYHNHQNSRKLSIFILIVDFNLISFLPGFSQFPDFYGSQMGQQLNL